MSGIYRSNEVGIGEFRRVNEVSFRLTSERIKSAAGIFDGLDMNIYYSVVPDKSIFSERYLPGFNLEKAEGIINGVLREYEYIRLSDVLEASCFYKTDPHWNQSQISVAANYLLSSMGADSVVGDYPEVIAGEFRGAYAGQFALPIAPDVMTYLETPVTEAGYIDERTLEFGTGPVYDLSRFAGVDPYDLFLRGPQPLIILENEGAPEQELYLFRDSFGSSLAPLLTSAYSRITVIDLRYIHISLVEQLVEFKPGSDILFIYSSQIFNNPSVLLV
jgi:hypothetical protein